MTIDVAVAKAMAGSDTKVQNAPFKKAIEILTNEFVVLPVGHFTVASRGSPDE